LCVGCKAVFSGSFWKICPKIWGRIAYKAERQPLCGVTLKAPSADKHIISYPESFVNRFQKKVKHFYLLRRYNKKYTKRCEKRIDGSVIL
jgi:hypothetical protein